MAAELFCADFSQMGRVNNNPPNPPVNGINAPVRMREKKRKIDS